MFLDFIKWVKSIQTAGYNGARTVVNPTLIFGFNIKTKISELLCTQLNCLFTQGVFRKIMKNYVLVSEFEKTSKITKNLQTNIFFFIKNAIRNHWSTFLGYFLSILDICFIENNFLT